MSLSEIVEQILYPLVSADSLESQDILLGVWNKLRPIDLLPFHKLLTVGSVSEYRVEIYAKPWRWWLMWNLRSFRNGFRGMGSPSENL